MSLLEALEVDDAIKVEVDLDGLPELHKYTEVELLTEIGFDNATADARTNRSAAPIIIPIKFIPNTVYY